MAAHAPIVTLTMNPALDVSTSTARVVPERKLRCGATRLDPGGGGVNVSRAVQSLGGRSLAIYPLGGPTGQAYRQLLEGEAIVGRAVTISGSTRESFTVDETGTGEQFRFVLQGPQLSEPEWRACMTAVGDLLPVGGYLVLSGSLPPGAPDDFYARLAAVCRDNGVLCVVDTSGPALAAALEAGVHLIKPSLRELAELVGAEHLDAADRAAAARTIVERGQAEVVALTLGGDGATLVTADEVVDLPTPYVEVRSAVGAGDSFLAALVLRRAQGHDWRSAFRTAVAAGSATAMLPATELCHADDVARLEAQLPA